MIPIKTCQKSAGGICERRAETSNTRWVDFWGYHLSLSWRMLAGDFLPSLSRVNVDQMLTPTKWTKTETNGPNFTQMDTQSFRGHFQLWFNIEQHKILDHSVRRYKDLRLCTRPSWAPGQSEPHRKRVRSSLKKTNEWRNKNCHFSNSTDGSQEILWGVWEEMNRKEYSHVFSDSKWEK